MDDSVVQLHLSHRLVQRLLGRFTSQGFVYHDLSRACLATSDDNTARVVLLGRLAVFGPNASRLHEEILTVTARWQPAAERPKPLEPFGSAGERTTLDILQRSMRPENLRELPEATREKLAASIEEDVAQLHAHLEPRGMEALAEAKAKLLARGEAEARELTHILEDQQKRVSAELKKHRDNPQGLLKLGDNQDELRQRAHDIKYWEDWLQNVDGDLQREPARIREFYSVKSYRIEPVGLVYLIPA